MAMILVMFFLVSRPVLLVDFSFLPRHKTGTRTYAEGYLRWIMREALDRFRVVILIVIDDPLIRDFRLDESKCKIVFLPKNLMARHIASQIFGALMNFCDSPTYLCLAYWQPLFFFKKKIVVLHDATVYSHPETHLRRTVLIHGFFIRLALKDSKTIPVTVSKSSREELKKFVGSSKDIFLMPPILESGQNDIFTCDSSADSDFFLTVGTIEPRKNHVQLLAAWVNFFKNNPDRRLVVVGKVGWKCANTLKLLSMTDGVEYVGHVDDSTLKQLYKHCQGVIYVPKQEGFGLPVYEGLEYCKPVLISNIKVFDCIKHVRSVIRADPDDVASLTLGLMLLDKYCRSKTRDAFAERIGYDLKSDVSKLLEL